MHHLALIIELDVAAPFRGEPRGEVEPSSAGLDPIGPLGANDCLLLCGEVVIASMSIGHVTDGTD